MRTVAGLLGFVLVGCSSSSENSAPAADASVSCDAGTTLYYGDCVPVDGVPPTPVEDAAVDAHDASETLESGPTCDAAAYTTCYDACQLSCSNARQTCDNNANGAAGAAACEREYQDCLGDCEQTCGSTKC
jgi:hypothetical protein